MVRKVKRPRSWTFAGHLSVAGTARYRCAQKERPKPRAQVALTQSMDGLRH